MADENNQVKPGWKTSEFWLTAAVSVGSVAALAGVIGPEQQNAIQDGVQHLVTGVKEIILGVTTLAPVVSYIVGRNKLKAGK